MALLILDADAFQGREVGSDPDHIQHEDLLLVHVQGDAVGVIRPIGRL